MTEREETVGELVAAVLIEQYKENTQEITKISQERDALREKTDKEISDLRYDVYEDKIRALEEERDEKITLIRNALCEKEGRAKEQIEKLHEPIAKVERILGFLGLELRPAKWIDFKESEVRGCGDRPVYSSGTLYKDDFLKIALFIYENRKPKNKYSLVAAGKIKFGDKIFGYDYGVDLDTHNLGFGIKKHIKDAPTIEELKAYLEKHKEELFKAQLEQYQNVKKEYLSVLRVYKIDDFKELIKYRCKKCNFFLTDEEAGHYRTIDENKKCPRCEGVMEERVEND